MSKSLIVVPAADLFIVIFLSALKSSSLFFPLIVRLLPVILSSSVNAILLSILIIALFTCTAAFNALKSVTFIISRKL